MLNKRLIRLLDEKVLNTPLFAKFVAPCLALMPLDEIKKNILLNKREATKGKLVLRSHPYKGVLNLTDMCNLRCAFCEIHYIYNKFKRLYPNFVDINVLKKYSIWLQYLYNLEFYGATGEPLLNKNFADIVKFLKTTYGTRLFVNTNGILLDEKVTDTMVKYGFDDVLISVHAGKEETYNKLVGGNFSKLLNNIKYLVAKKKELGKSKPLVGLAFLLNKINATDIEDFINLAVRLDVDYINVFHYYDVRNKLTKNVSFYFDPEEGNRILDKIYELANTQGIKIFPLAPPYLPAHVELEEIMGSEEIEKRRCYEPWSTIKFKGCIEHPNSHYITVCNRILLFRINYNEYDIENDFDFIWNHPILQYMRETVNSNSDELNPICAFCKNRSTPILRCIDNKRYRELRDNAVRDFFKEVKKSYDLPEKQGLYLLDRNPYE